MYIYTSELVKAHLIFSFYSICFGTILLIPDVLRIKDVIQIYGYFMCQSFSVYPVTNFKVCAEIIFSAMFKAWSSSYSVSPAICEAAKVNGMYLRPPA